MDNNTQQKTSSVGGHLVIGHGEIGTAIASILGCDWQDFGEGHVTCDKYHTLHICIPWSEKFIKIVQGYEELYGSTLTVVHSTVPVRTCDKLGAVHSPCRGVHPHLEEGIRTFVKFFGGEDHKVARAARPFVDLGIACIPVEGARNTEAMKLWDTTQHGVAIRLMQEIHDYCEKNDLDFDTVYTLANHTYNRGYAKLGMEHFCRPVLKYMGKGIGGHCIGPNCKMLNSPTAEWLQAKAMMDKINN